MPIPTRYAATLSRGRRGVLTYQKATGMPKLRPINALDKLELVLALAREQHFGRAAEACGITQPTLSAGLKALEDALGILIVRRSSRFQGFTPEGLRVLAWARRLVGEAEAMCQDIDALKRGLDGHLRLAVIPTALPVMARLTVPFRTAHPGVRITILSRTSSDVLESVDNLDADAGVTYLDNEPLGPMRSIPLYKEDYRLLTARAGILGERRSVSWQEVGQLPLCLLTADMQNRRIVDDMFRRAGVQAAPTLESNSTIVLISHLRTGQWSSILPSVLVESIGLSPAIASIPIVEPIVTHAVGLIVPRREVAPPIVTALIQAAWQLSRELESS